MFFIFYSCTPRTIVNEGILINERDNNEIEKPIEKEIKEENLDQNSFDSSVTSEHGNIKIISEIQIILPSKKNIDITNNLINSIELSIHKKNIKNLSINIHTYSEKKQLYEMIKTNGQPGKIFIGPLTSDDAEDINNFCSLGIVFFSFASKRKLASDCVYLINFFPEDDLRALFNYFDSNDRIALIYPENNYGNYINDIIDIISTNSHSIIVNKVSYLEDISNARDAIKLLGKYEIRKQELERQKGILQNKDDEISKRALKKIEKFETIGDLDFTHLIIADYNIRLLEIAPLLPFYDIDPNKIQFVGTGVWDDKTFFNEPSLQRAIFPGVSIKKRQSFIDEYINVYNSKPKRIVTIMYDLIGLISYIVENQPNLESAFKFLNDQSLSFEGIDGKFSFENNLIKRELGILQIIKGEALLIK